MEDLHNIKLMCKTSAQKTAFNALLRSFSNEVNFLDRNEVRENANFEPGQKVLIMKYDDSHNWLSVWGIRTIVKVNKNSIVVDSEIGTGGTKMDKNGIIVKKVKNKYTGNYTIHWVAYNKELAKNLPDLNEIMKNGTVGWGFHATPKDEATISNELKEAIKEL